MPSKRFTALALLAALALAPGPADASGPPSRAVWMWEPDSFALLGDADATGDAIAFLRSQGIDTVYLYADAWEGRTPIADDPAAYHVLVARLRGAGIQVHALLGSWYLRTHEYVLPERRGDAVAMFRRVLEYNAGAPAVSRFDAVSLDIEPHVLDAWDDHRDTLLGGFLDLLHAYAAMRDASGQSLPIGAAIPFWLDNIPLDWQGRTRAVSEHAIDLLDYAALMDYRHRAEGGDGIVSHASDEMAQARRAGKRIVVGVEVSPNELAKVTFDGLAPADLERELAATAAAFEGDPAFAGFAIHHYRTLREWLARPR